MQNKLNGSAREKYGSGADTMVMAAVLLSIIFCLFYIFAPYFSAPELKYVGMESVFTIWNIESNIELIGNAFLINHQFSFSYSAELVHILLFIVKILVSVNIALLLFFAVKAYRYKYMAIKLGRFTYIFSMIAPAVCIALCTYLNVRINDAMNVENTFLNLTVFSKMQPTSYPYMQMFLSVIMVAGMRRLLDTRERKKQTDCIPCALHEDGKLSKRTKTAVFIILFLIPLFISFGIIFLKGRSYYFISLCIIITAMIPFVMVFEDRKPQAREIILISVLVVIATAGRAAFFMLPNFKPVTAIIIIAGVTLGAEAGFLTGAMTGFVSNLFFGQGPWTPWQMFAFGIIGFLAGLIFRNNRARLAVVRPVLCAFGAVSSFFIYGFIMDTSSVFTFLNGLTWQAALAKYISGIPVNFMHAVSTVVFLYIISGPMIKKIERIKIKYGMLTP